MNIGPRSMSNLEPHGRNGSANRGNWPSRYRPSPRLTAHNNHSTNSKTEWLKERAAREKELAQDMADLKAAAQRRDVEREAAGVEQQVIHHT